MTISYNVFFEMHSAREINKNSFILAILFVHKESISTYNESILNLCVLSTQGKGLIEFLSKRSILRFSF